MKLRYLLAAFLCLSLFELSAFDRLRVEDPQRPWNRGQGTIEEAIVSVRPQGLYMEYGLYLTFSAQGLGFSNSDTLEVQYWFDLPEGAIVHDSWLWVEDDIIRGEILDKWTASAIYDTIVNRRQDPSILWKRSQTQYELRIYPMAGNESRKVKLTYLVPANWGSTDVWAELPTNLLRTSSNPLNTFHCLTWLDEPSANPPQWMNPSIAEFSAIEFEARSDTVFGDYYRADIPPTAIQGPLHFSVTAPYNEGVYINRFAGSENYYQMAFLPSRAFSFTPKKKVAVCFDYRSIKSNVTRSQLLNTTQALLENSLSEIDSFNIFSSQLNIFQAEENWVNGGDASIQSVFNNIPPDTPADYSNLPSLLSEAINFIGDNGNDGSILLITSSDGIGDFQTANQLISHVLAEMNSPIPIHIADFQSQNYVTHWIGGRQYYGNEYFYTNLSRRSGGEFNRMLTTSNSLFDVINQGLDALNGYINTLDIYTTLENGFCYARQYPNQANTGANYFNTPILQIGKYSGSFPFKLEASGFFEDQPFNQQFTIYDNEVFETDTLSEEIWEGIYIQNLEKQPQSNAIISEIIDRSLEERILSLYSAFLCLDPARGGQICYDCRDESGLVGIDNTINNLPDSLSVAASPNPFNSQTRINITLSQPTQSNLLSFRIFNILGQQVKAFDNSKSQDGKTFQFNWNGTNDTGSKVATGTYFFVMTTPTNKRTLKLLLVN